MENMWLLRLIIMKVQLTLEGSSIQGIASFYREINRGFMAEEEWDIAN